MNLSCAKRALNVSYLLATRYHRTSIAARHALTTKFTVVETRQRCSRDRGLRIFRLTNP
jgi:hypothetical protein